MYRTSELLLPVPFPTNSWKHKWPWEEGALACHKDLGRSGVVQNFFSLHVYIFGNKLKDPVPLCCTSMFRCLYVLKPVSLTLSPQPNPYPNTELNWNIETSTQKDVGTESYPLSFSCIAKTLPMPLGGVFNYMGYSKM